MLYTKSKLIELGLNTNDIDCLHTLASRYLLVSSKSTILIKIKDLVTFSIPSSIADTCIQLFNSLSEEATSIAICSCENKVMETLDLNSVLDIFEIHNHVIITMKE